MRAQVVGERAAGRRRAPVPSVPSAPLPPAPVPGAAVPPPPGLRVGPPPKAASAGPICDSTHVLLCRLDLE